MAKFCGWLTLFCLSVLAARSATETPEWVIRSLDPTSEILYELDKGIATATNGVIVTYGTKTLTVSNADSFVHLDHGDTPGPCAAEE